MCNFVCAYRGASPRAKVGASVHPPTHLDRECMISRRTRSGCERKVRAPRKRVNSTDLRWLPLLRCLLTLRSPRDEEILCEKRKRKRKTRKKWSKKKWTPRERRRVTFSCTVFSILERTMWLGWCTVCEETKVAKENPTPPRPLTFFPGWSPISNRSTNRCGLFLPHFYSSLCISCVKHRHAKPRSSLLPFVCLVFSSRIYRDVFPALFFIPHFFFFFLSTSDDDCLSKILPWHRNFGKYKQKNIYICIHTYTARYQRSSFLDISSDVVRSRLRFLQKPCRPILYYFPWYWWWW